MKYEVIIATRKYYDDFKNHLATLDKDICHITKDMIEVMSPIFRLTISRNPYHFRGYRPVDIYADEEIIEDDDLKEVLAYNLLYAKYIRKLDDYTMRYCFGIYTEREE